MKLKDGETLLYVEKVAPEVAAKVDAIGKELEGILDESRIYTNKLEALKAKADALFKEKWCIFDLEHPKVAFRPFEEEANLRGEERPNLSRRYSKETQELAMVAAKQDDCDCGLHLDLHLPESWRHSLVLEGKESGKTGRGAGPA